MRIAMVSEHASPLAALGGVDAGGQNVHVAALSTGLARRGHDVRVYTRRDDPDLPQRVELAPGVEVVHVDAGPAGHVPKDDMLPFMPALAAGMAADWLEWEPDVVHSHFWMSGVAALDAAGRLAAPPPLVHTFHALGVVKRRHQGADDTSPAEREWLEPDVGRRVAGVVATCSDEAFELKKLGVPPRNISVIPCGVDLDHFSPGGEREQRRRRHRVLSVGRLVPRKGVGTVIEAIAEVAAEGFDVELVVVGGGAAGPRGADPEVDRLERIAALAGVADRVELRGQVPQSDLPDVYRSADVVVCAPWYEPFGIVPLEAMACGVPVVASSVGGLIDSVVDGGTGRHVPPRDVAAVAAAIRGLLLDDQLRRQLGENGRRRMTRRYAWSRIAADTERTYLATIAEARGTTTQSSHDPGAIRRTRGATR
ncbi:glycosyltransferase [Agromyces salentinus]|uniref:D-inositol 3-phosphate glycosyltransferase n=1 Tax=Agromyces salentinus TaxID=269421 RepID=A0ABN2MZ12_9MICO|nr:glycosyltransferase [Agromyces salentinus]